MATQAPSTLPLLYNDLQPLNSQGHGGSSEVRSVTGIERVARPMRSR